MPIAARSAPNNGQVKEAKVSSCTRGTGKALNGKVKEVQISKLMTIRKARLGKLNEIIEMRLKEGIRIEIIKMM